MRIVDKKLSELKPYENNPRNNERAVEPVMNSLKEFGFKQPIVIDTDGTIIVGHTRFEAAKRLGLETVPCLVANDLTPAQIQAYRLVDNKTNEFADWDFEKLSEELDGLSIDFDMSEFGFDFNIFETQTFSTNTSGEINTENYEDGKFEHECPRCGFKFND